MKRFATASLCLAAALYARAISFEWSADIDRPGPAVFVLAEGETAELACRLVRRGRDFDPAATSATLYYQTNGMGRSWWTAPAAVSGPLLRATLQPAIAPAAPVVHAMIGASGPSGLVYRAAVDLRYLPSPGAVPNALPMPVPSIDFATVSITNAPWALAADVSTNYLPLSGGTVSGDVLLATAARADSVTVTLSGSLYYLNNYDSPMTISFTLPDFDAVAVGQRVEATYSHSYGAVEPLNGYVSAVDGAAGVSVMIADVVHELTMEVTGISRTTDPAFPLEVQLARFRLCFDTAECSWSTVPVSTVSRYVTEADLAAATNALYQLIINH